MDLWFATLLGIVQGITEFLPISSTAHLRITPALLGIDDPGAAFTAVIQLGTLVAVIVYFRNDLIDMARGLLAGRASPQTRLFLYVCAGTVPIGIAGLAFKDVIVGDARSLYVVAVALLVVAIVMWGADRVGRQGRLIPDLRLADALIIGAAQACALIPGVSRSGATIAAALFLGMRRDDAARFSFLLSIPALGAAGVFELPDAVREIRGMGEGSLVPLAVATIVSGITGYAAIAWLLRFLRTSTLGGFVLYRLALGGLILGLLAAGILVPL
jgi:undecaprenyl-diphosphatase